MRAGGLSRTRATLLGITHPMTWQGLADAIPPAYTHWIGGQLLGTVTAPASRSSVTTSDNTQPAYPPPFMVDTSDDGQMPLPFPDWAHDE